MNQNRRSHAMDGLKLLFMLLIVVHHSGYYFDVLHLAGTSVDLFFMISGYFLYHALQKKPNLGAGTYLLDRYRKLYPHYFLSFVVMFLSTSVYRVGTITLDMLLRALPEILLVQNLGFFWGGVNYPCWHLCVLIYAGTLVFFLGRKLPKKCFHALGLFCAIVAYVYILCFPLDGKIEPFRTVGVFYLPFWRGMAGLFCGALIYELHGSLQPVFRKYAAVFRVLEIASLIGSIALMFSSGLVDILIVICFFVLLLCVGSESSVLERLFHHPAVAASIRYEYPVFLNHAFVTGILRKLFVDHFGFPAPVNLAVLLIVLVVYSVITEAIVRKGMEWFSEKRKKAAA